MYRNHEESDTLTPDERLRAIAKILAVGVLRLHARAALVVVDGETADSEKLQKSGQNQP
jgi:hypothetical protein